MDSNWNAPQSGGATRPSSGIGSADWRSQLQPDARQRIVNKIMDTLKRHLPVPVPEGINELQKIAVQFEEKIYSAACSQPDYLRKCSLKMLSMENKTQPGLNPSLPNQNRMDPGPTMDSNWNAPQSGGATGLSSGVGSDSNANPDWRSQLQPDDWQEEMYHRLKYMKDTYFADLREIHQKLSMKLSQLDSLVPPNARGGEQIEKMKHFKMVLERMMAVLQLGKHQMQIGLKDKLSLYEKQIQSILQNRKKAPQEQPQAGASSDQPHYPGLQQLQPGLQSQQLPQQHQPQQMDSQNQIQQQLKNLQMDATNSMH